MIVELFAGAGGAALGIRATLPGVPSVLVVGAALEGPYRLPIGATGSTASGGRLREQV